MRAETRRASPSAAAWWLAVRPRTLGASLVPVGVGLSLASRSGPLDCVVASATLGAALMLQIAANLANDYYDFAHGVDTGDRLGPTRVTQAGLLEPRAVKHATLAALALALLLGIVLASAGGWWIVAIGVGALVGAVAYSAGPWPLAWYGLGDLLAFVFFGPVAVCGTVLLQHQAVGVPCLSVALPVACLVTAIMVVNNLRDIPTDRATGKRTFAVRVGPTGTRIEYAALVALAFVSLPLVASLVTRAALLALLAMPLAVFEVIAVCKRDGAALNRSLAGTARLHFVAGTLLILGLIQ